MNKALIVIDVQKYFFNPQTKPIVKRIQKFLKNKASQYSSVYFTVFKNDSSSPLSKLSGWKECSDYPSIDVCDEIKEFTNDKNLFYKNNYSAYKIPEILKSLKEKNISKVYLCGFDTDCCILATAYDLFDTGIKPVILENLTASTSKERLHKPALQILKRNIGFVERINI